MGRSTLKGRALSFAVGAGLVAFVLALLAGAQATLPRGDWARALILAIVCGAFSWASAQRAIAGYAEAIDHLIDRVAAAAQGDLSAPAPPQVDAVLPQLARSLDDLFAQVRSNIETVHTLAMIDSVTQLPNRICFRRDASRILENLPEDGVAALFFIDLDKFKEVNDSFGHAQGDHLLAGVADRLRALASTMADGDRTPLVARLAGDEFTMLVPNLSCADEAERCGDAILDTLCEPYDILGQSVEVGASVGVALRPDQGSTLSDLMRAADVAMYRAKETGRARLQLFTPSLAARLADNLRLEHELRSGIDRREFLYYFQPQIALSDGSAIGAEALLRWQHPTRGLLSPDSFLAHAEQTGLIHELGFWAVEEAAETIGRWGKAGMTIRLCANLSARQVVRPDFFGQIRSAMASHGAPARLLELEVGETTALKCDDAALAGLAYMREQGATVAIDSFGAGSLSLARLRDFPIDRIKISRHLVADLVPSAQTRTVVQAVIGLAHGLGCQVTADGVETPAQRAILQVGGCDAVQGFAMARPMEEAELLAWLGKDAAWRARA